nr:hypothetical protein [Phycicoccus sp.]
MAVRPPRRTAAAPPHLSGIRRVAVRAVVLLLLLLVTAPVAPPALADGIASLTIDTVSPPVALSGQQVTVTGTVDNTGTTAIPAGQVIAQIDSRSLTTQGEMDAWFDQSTPADGAVVAQVDLPEVPPQGQAAFTLTIGQFSTGRTAAFGVVPLTISAAGVTTHTALGYQRIKEYQPLNVAVLVPVTITANAALVGPPGEARTTAWRTALQSGSRLDQLLPLLSRDGVQAAVDPTLLGVSVAPDGTAIAGLPAVIPPGPNAAPSTTPNASASATPGGTPSVAATPSSPTPSAAQSGSASTTPTPTPTLTAAPGTTLDETRVRAAFPNKLTAALARTDPFLLPVGDP